MIELLQILLKRFHSYSAEYLATATISNLTPTSNGNENSRDRVKSLDDTLDKSDRKKFASSPLPPQLGVPFVINQTEEEKNKLKSFVDVIKAGLNCLTRYIYICIYIVLFLVMSDLTRSIFRWAVNHPTLIESPEMKELFFDVRFFSSFISLIKLFPVF